MIVLGFQKGLNPPPQEPSTGRGSRGHLAPSPPLAWRHEKIRTGGSWTFNGILCALCSLQGQIPPGAEAGSTGGGSGCSFNEGPCIRAAADVVGSSA